MFPLKNMTFFPLFLGLLQAYIGVISGLNTFYPLNSGTEKKNICLLLHYATLKKNAEEALELKINHNPKLETL